MMRTNKTKKTKVLIIDDEREHFDNIKKWLETFDYIVIPDKFDDMEKAIKRIGPGIDTFVQKLLLKHYRDIGLILCDIKFGDDIQKGNRIVEHIREFKELSPSYWTSIVPIIGMTLYSADRITIEHEMVKAGADFIFKKWFIFNDLTDGNNGKNYEAKTYRTIIDVQVEKFEKNLKSIYPPEYKDRIIKAKKKHKNHKTAFIISSFRYEDLIKRVEKTLKEYGIIPLVANIKGGRYTKPLWEDIVIHSHVCDFGIAIYADDSLFNKRDKKHRDKMNPNVNIEVGLMLGLQKDVLFLKHESIPKLPSDFGGEQYVPFIDASLEEELRGWLEERGYKKKLSETSSSDCKD